MRYTNRRILYFTLRIDATGIWPVKPEVVFCLVTRSMRCVDGMLAVLGGGAGITAAASQNTSQ